MKLNNENPLIDKAVSAYNEKQKQAALGEGVRLLEQQKHEQAKIDACKARIAEKQAELKKVSGDVIDEASVFGGSVPANANHDTIVAVIAKANQDRQFGIEQRTAALTTGIVAEQDAIKAIEDRIGKLVEQLVKLTPQTVEASQVVGS